LARSPRILFEILIRANLKVLSVSEIVVDNQSEFDDGARHQTSEIFGLAHFEGHAHGLHQTRNVVTRAEEGFVCRINTQHHRAR